MSFEYQKIGKNDLILEDWKRYLTPTKKAIFDGELEDHDWYGVLENNEVIAIFQIIDVLKKYAKNLEIHFHPNFKPNDHNIIDIIFFIYESMLRICDNKKIKKLKLYIDNSLIYDIFTIIATHQAKNRDIINTINYGKWIEIQIK